MYDRQVFDYISRLEPSARGELEVTDVNNFYLNDNKLRWQELQGYWTDAGTFESLHRANRFWATQRGWSESDVETAESISAEIGDDD
jgi:glucose-1-phosphate thymidylyltransferase